MVINIVTIANEKVTLQETVQNLIEAAENLTITIGEKRKGYKEVVE